MSTHGFDSNRKQDKITPDIFSINSELSFDVFNRPRKCLFLESHEASALTANLCQIPDKSQPSS
ncbi:hypothetical protein ACHAWX_007211 [Stephanocyclus meneghinianus]